MLTVATADNPTAIPANDPGRVRQRDAYSWSGIRIAWDVDQRRAYLKMIKRLKARGLINVMLEAVLRDLANRQSEIDPDYCPSVEELAEPQRCSVRTVQRHLRVAEALNILETRPRHRLGCGKRATRKTTQTTNFYVLLLPTEDEIGIVVEIKRPVEKPAAGVTRCHPTTERFYLPASFRAADAVVEAIRAERFRRMGIEGSGGITLRAWQPASPFSDSANLDPVDRVTASLALKTGDQAVSFACIRDMHSHHTGLRRQRKEDGLASSHGTALTCWTARVTAARACSSVP